MKTSPSVSVLVSVDDLLQWYHKTQRTSSGLPIHTGRSSISVRLTPFISHSVGLRCRPLTVSTLNLVVTDQVSET